MMSEGVGRFTGFGIEVGAHPAPYLVERLMATVYQRVGAPNGLLMDDLIAWASDRSVLAKRRMCLVIGPSNCIYLEPDGSWAYSSQPPSGGVAITDR